MSPANGHALRRSSRVPIQVPIHVTSLEPNTKFADVCETLVVNAHGCALRFPFPLNAGSALQLHSRDGREATAHVVACLPIGTEGRAWTLGAKLDQPENFWGLESCPEDWRTLAMPASAADQPRQKMSTAPAVVYKAQSRPKVPETILEKIGEQLSDDRLQGILARLVRPLQAELTELQEKLVRHARQNRFEVSLGQIPPQLEEKLWERLRNDLGARVLEQTREQSAELLASAKAGAEQKIGAALTEFRHRLSGELHVVEQRAQELSMEISAGTRQRVQSEVEKLQKQALDAGALLNAQSEKLSKSLEQRLTETHDVQRREMEQLHTAAAAKASQLESEVADLAKRMAALNESVRHLESDLDSHLERIGSEVVSTTRTQLESAVDLVLKEFQARSSKEVDSRLDELCGHLRTIQNRIEHSFSGSLTTQGDEALESLGRQFEDLGQKSIERWRLTLARDLSSVARSLGQQMRQEFNPESDGEGAASTG
jgi:hypothetical protein